MAGLGLGRQCRRPRGWKSEEGDGCGGDESVRVVRVMRVVRVVEATAASVVAEAAGRAVRVLRVVEASAASAVAEASWRGGDDGKGGDSCGGLGGGARL